MEDNLPASVGQPLPGIEVKTGADDELLTRSPSVMLGYWNNETATREVIGADGWLRTGDQVRIDERGHVFITGRLKEIIVLSNGEKLPPGDMELAIALDPLVEQVMVIGEGRPYLVALVVPDSSTLSRMNAELGIATGASDLYADPHLTSQVLQRVQNRLRTFPGYAKLHRVGLIEEPWSIENSMMTPTLKLRRDRILARHGSLVDRLYAGH